MAGNTNTLSGRKGRISLVIGIFIIIVVVCSVFAFFYFRFFSSSGWKGTVQATSSDFYFGKTGMTPSQLRDYDEELDSQYASQCGTATAPDSKCFPFVVYSYLSFKDSNKLSLSVEKSAAIKGLVSGWKPAYDRQFALMSSADAVFKDEYYQAAYELALLRRFGLISSDDYGKDQGMLALPAYDRLSARYVLWDLFMKPGAGEPSPDAGLKGRVCAGLEAVPVRDSCEAVEILEVADYCRDSLKESQVQSIYDSVSKMAAAGNARFDSKYPQDLDGLKESCGAAIAAS